jgi:hypothetical protein
MQHLNEIISIKIDSAEVDLLNEMLEDDSNLKKHLKIASFQGRYIASIDSKFGLNLSELLSDKVIEVGFDKNYALNPVGKIYQNLVDKIFASMHKQQE